jgi:uncharacterized membrane protein
LQNNLLFCYILLLKNKKYCQYTVNNISSINKQTKEKVVEEKEENKLVFKLLSQLKTTSSATFFFNSDNKEYFIKILFISATINIYIVGITEFYYKQYLLKLVLNPTFQNFILEVYI